MKALLQSYGFDDASKGSGAVTIESPPAVEAPPDAELLLKLQKYGGEFNWLATRTRPDLAYFASVIMSQCTRHGDWVHQLCRKVLRYLLATRWQGILVKARSTSEIAHSPSRLTIWTDAGYGGEGTKAQTGVFISWDSAVVCARSSRQHKAALSTCEAEVAASATGFTLGEALQLLITEWDVELAPPYLLIDNKSALDICHGKGTWKTKYFAIRAARIAQEFSLGNVVIRYCQTALMLADGLTKFAASNVMMKMRDGLDGNTGDVDAETVKLNVVDDTWWANSIRCYRAIVARANEPELTWTSSNSTWVLSSEDMKLKWLESLSAAELLTIAQKKLSTPTSTTK